MCSNIQIVHAETDLQFTPQSLILRILDHKLLQAKLLRKLSQGLL